MIFEKFSINLFPAQVNKNERIYMLPHEANLAFTITYPKNCIHGGGQWMIIRVFGYFENIQTPFIQVF